MESKQNREKKKGLTKRCIEQCVHLKREFTKCSCGESVLRMYFANPSAIGGRVGFFLGNPRSILLLERKPPLFLLNCFAISLINSINSTSMNEAHMANPIRGP